MLRPVLTSVQRVENYRLYFPVSLVLPDRCIHARFINRSEVEANSWLLFLVSLQASMVVVMWGFGQQCYGVQSPDLKVLEASMVVGVGPLLISGSLLSR